MLLIYNYFFLIISAYIKFISNRKKEYENKYNVKKGKKIKLIMKLCFN
jgi:hypothetical protein